MPGLWVPGGACRCGPRTARAAPDGGPLGRPHPFAVPGPALSDIHPGEPGPVTPPWPGAPLDSPELVRATPRPRPRGAPGPCHWSGGARLDRGRSRARAGQVLAPRIDAAAVRAEARGGRPRLGLATFGKAGWSHRAGDGGPRVVRGQAL